MVIQFRVFDNQTLNFKFFISDLEDFVCSPCIFDQLFFCQLPYTLRHEYFIEQQKVPSCATTFRRCVQGRIFHHLSFKIGVEH